MTFILVLGIALLAFVGFFLLRDDMAFLSSDTVRTIGKVTGHRKGHDDGADFYSAIIEFSDQQGETHRLEDTYGRRSPFPAAGAEIGVVYPAGTPQRARVPRPLVRIILYLFVFGVMTVLLSKLLRG